jgi:hypothetical protein
VSTETEAAILNFIIDGLQIDDDWFEWGGRGFRWWAGLLAQRIAFSPRRDLHGVAVSTLHIDTDLIAGVPLTVTTWERLAGVNRFATLSAYVADVPARTISLHASVAVTSDNWMMARALALHAAALQVADAHAEAAELASAFGGSVGASGHPIRGRRDMPDEMLGILDSYQQRGQEPSPLTTEEIAQLVHLEPRPWLLAVNEPDRLIADLAFAAGRPARIEVDRSVKHPALGSGVQVRLAIPVESDAAIAQRLNAEEVRQPDAHQLGAWCLDPEHGVAFVSFIPSAACMPNLLPALVYHAAGRNEWTREVLFPE